MPGSANARKRQLGLTLVRLRKAAGLTAADAARHMDVAPPTVHRWEKGENSPTKAQLDTLLTFYNASPQEKDAAFTRLADARQPTARIEHASAVPRQFRSFLRSEADAIRERATSLTVVHGLLQTEAYARATTVPADGLGGVRDPEKFVASRLARQARLGQLDLHVVLDESLIHRVIGGRDVMRGQLDHLIECATRRRITLQVLPFDAPQYIPLVGPITILDYGEAPTSVYLEQVPDGVWVDNPQDVALFVGAFGKMAGMALTTDETVRLLKVRLRDLA